MPRRNRPPRWALVVIAVVGTFFGTAAAAQPSHHGPPPHADDHVPSTVPPTVPPTEPPSTVPSTTVPPSTVPPTTEPTTTTTEAPPPPSTTEPPISEPTTTTTEAPPPPSTTEPPIGEPSTTTTEAPTPTTDPGDGDDPDRSAVPPAPVVDDVTPTGGAAAGVGATADSTEQLVAIPDLRAAPTGDEAVALPAAQWTSADARALVTPPQPGETDTRPLWLAVLFGLGAGIGLTATASVVVNNLHREPAP